MTNEQTKHIILGFVTLLIGIVLIGTVATGVLDVTDRESIVNESISMQDAVLAANSVNESHVFTLGTLGDTAATDCAIESFVFSNSSDDAFTVTTDYVLTAGDGTFTLVNSTQVHEMLNNSAANTTLADYSYCPSGYMNLAWGRTVTNLVPGFFGLALLGVSLLVFFRIFKDAGVM